MQQTGAKANAQPTGEPGQRNPNSNVHTGTPQARGQRGIPGSENRSREHVKRQDQTRPPPPRTKDGWQDTQKGQARARPARTRAAKGKKNGGQRGQGRGAGGPPEAQRSTETTDRNVNRTGSTQTEKADSQGEAKATPGSRRPAETADPPQSGGREPGEGHHEETKTAGQARLKKRQRSGGRRGSAKGVSRAKTRRKKAKKQQAVNHKKRRRHRRGTAGGKDERSKGAGHGRQERRARRSHCTKDQPNRPPSPKRPTKTTQSKDREKPRPNGTQKHSGGAGTPRKTQNHRGESNEQERR